MNHRSQLTRTMRLHRKLQSRAYLWTWDVLKRDHYQCRHCSATNHLDAAHIIPKSRAPTLRYHLSNGITLCRTCHEYFHQHPAKWREFLNRL